MTRWYRAPEVILNASEYTKAVDIWSVGCIMAELYGRQPLFPGEDFLDQVQRIISVLGTPSPDDMKYIGKLFVTKAMKMQLSISNPFPRELAKAGTSCSAISIPKRQTF